MVYDLGILDRLGSVDNVIKYWNDAAPHLQARYCHASLGTKIKIERTAHHEHGEWPVINANLHASTEMLDWLQGATSFILGDADLVVYMANNVHSTNSGYGYIAQACSNDNRLKASINQWQYNPSKFGAVCTY